MRKRLLSLLLTLVLLLCAAAGLGEQTTTLSAARISTLQRLAGENGALWSEGTPPSAGMNAFQMWQWTDWFLSSRVRSLLGALQDVEQLDSDKSLDGSANDDQWALREIESTLSRFEAQLEEDRLAIVNGIGLLQSGGITEDERLSVCSRIQEAESEIKEIIAAICREYNTYLAAVEACDSRLLAQYGSYAETVHSDAKDGLAQSAKNREDSENSAAANSGFQVSVSSTAQIKIQVVGPSLTSLSGAKVTVTNRLNTSKTKTVTTDAQGNAVFWVSDLGADEKSDLRLNVRIEASGCRTREVQTVRLRSGETKKYYMQNDDGPYLIMGCFNGRDILTESQTYYCTKKNTLNHAFTVKLHCDKDGELELRYPVNANATEYKTVVKKFTAADSDKTVFKFEDQWLSKLPPGAKVSFTIKAGGKSYTTETYLDIQKAMVEEPFFSKSALFSFTSGVTGLGFNVPGKVPFISGSRVAFEIPGKLPQVVYLPSHYVMFAWGYDFKPEAANWQSEDAEAQSDAIKSFQAKSKADKALAAAGTYRNVNTTTTWKFLANYGASVTPFVSAQGLYRSSDRSLELRGAAGATLAFKAEATQTFTIGPVPFFAGVDFSMGISFGMDITLKMNLDVIDGAPKVVKGPDIGYGSGLSISLRLEMGLSGGVGLKKVASLGFRFYGYLNPIVHFTYPKVTADAKLGLGFEVTARLLFIKWHATIWKGELSLGENAATDFIVQPQTVRLSFEGAREQLCSDPNSPNSTTSDEGLKPSETKKLFDLLDIAADDPQFATVDTETYMFWIQPGTDGHAAQLNWYNLSELNQYLQHTIEFNQVSHGNVGHLVGDQSNSLRQNKYSDYAFALKAKGKYCALTILSGAFSSAGSGEDPAPPSQACVATVLMKRNDGTGSGETDNTGNLDIKGYQEGLIFDQGDDYPIMPEVRLLVNNSVLSAFVTAGGPERINSRLYEYDDNYKDTTGKYLKKKWDLTCEDTAEITRYRIADVSAAGSQPFYSLSRTSLTEDAQGALSRLSGNARSKEVLAQGNIISFQVLPGGGAAPDRLFYLEQVKREGQDPVQRLRSVTPDGKKTDYDIETSATFFDIVQLGEGTYLYWAEHATPEDADPDKDYKEAYLVRCVRYDPGTDTVFGPFSLVELSERPSIVKLLDATTGFYAVDQQNANGSYQRCSVFQFSYTLVRSVELTSAVLLDPCVSAGDFADLSFSVRNTGSVPISAIELQIIDRPANSTTPTQVQTLRLDLDNPQESSSMFHSTGGLRTFQTETVARRLGNQHDPLNQEDWTITDTTAGGTTVRSVRTDLLLPGDARSYQTKIQIPADWAGGNTLEAWIVSVTGEASLSSTQTAAGQLLVGAAQTADSQTTQRLGSEAHKPIHTNAHDLMLSAQLFKRDGEDYVHITLRNRSGNTESDVIPVLTSRFRGQRLFSHEFLNEMGDDFGYTMDIPLSTLTLGRSLPELDLYADGKKVNGNSYEDFADADNHVRLLLNTQLCIVEHPQSIPVSAGAEAVFAVAAAGGDMPYRYQWQRMTGTDRWEDIPGAHSDTYRIASVRNEQNGLTVRCVVTDQFGDSVISDPAALSILPQTGDRSQPALWLLLALVSAAALAMARRRAF